MSYKLPEARDGQNYIPLSDVTDTTKRQYPQVKLPPSPDCQLVMTTYYVKDGCVYATAGRCQTIICWQRLSGRCTLGTSDQIAL